MAPYDAFLLVSFGGPEGPGDVIPFLQNVTAGRDIPAERLEQVAEHYYRFGGVSPINQQCRDLTRRDREGLRGHAASHLPVYWGNRNWDPYLTDTLAAMAADGVTPRAGLRDFGLQLVLQLPAVPRRHRGRPGAQVGAGAPRWTRSAPVLQPSGLHRPVRRGGRGGDRVAAGRHRRTTFDLIFTAHSIPASMADASRPGRRRLPGPAGRGGQAGRGGAGLPAAVAAGLLQPQRPAVGAVAGA